MNIFDTKTKFSYYSVLVFLALSLFSQVNGRVTDVDDEMMYWNCSVQRKLSKNLAMKYVEVSSSQNQDYLLEGVPLYVTHTMILLVSI
ncbi:unnamed protein product [Rotaria socialis]